ncbi:transposase domain-containing protein [Paucibacter sp. DJ2R-2]|nr:transposase domain-containing protein [Paucibacter sp. DJ2R-2]MCV2438654.1 transposase domain-containing protein [Paucibacter sp. DJ2R-2]
MSLSQSAKLNGREPRAFLKGVLNMLLAKPASRIAELVSHRWTQSA